MTQEKHTPKRLKFWSQDENQTVRDECDFPVAYYVSDNHAPRICAAWNACEGIPTEALEAGVVKDMLLDHIENERILSFFCNELQGRVEAGKLEALFGCLNRSRAAIARATGKNP